MDDMRTSLKAPLFTSYSEGQNPFFFFFFYGKISQKIKDNPDFSFYQSV